MLKIFHNSKNLSHLMSDLTSNLKAIDLTDGAIQIGFNKPLKNLYIEMQDRKTEGESPVFIEDEIVLKLTSSVGEIAPELEDLTFGLTRSGFLSWDNTEHIKSILNGIEAYWITITTSTPALVNIAGINLVLSNDKDLIGFFPNLLEYLPHGKSSFIGFHQEARNRIVQYIRNSGKVIIDHETLSTKQVDQFDILQIEEFRQASKYLALKLIYSWLSRDDQDKWEDKMRDAEDDYTASLNTRLMSIDTNNNGKGDDEDRNERQIIRIVNA